jgi:tetratricopeptide (TPR) repeat protein
MMRAILVAAVLLFAPATAGAEEWSGKVPAKARHLADRGRAFHAAGNYASAITAFTQAYKLAPSPALLFNLAQAYRLQGNCDTAAVMYERYLATNANPEGRALAEKHLASVARCRQKRALHAPVEPALRDLAVPPPPGVPGMVTTAPSRKPQVVKDVGIGLALGGGVAIGVATYYAVQAHDAANQVAALHAKHAKRKDIAPIDARGKSAATTAKIFGACGALGVGSGVVMYLMGKHSKRPPVTVTPRGGGAEVSMRWTF